MPDAARSPRSSSRAILVWAGLVVVVVLYFAFALLSDERSRLTILNNEGAISSGTILGVEIGGSLQAVIPKLEAIGWNRWDGKLTRWCEGQEDIPYREMAIFFDSSWRHGSLCIGANADKIERIVWRFNPYQVEF